MKKLLLLLPILFCGCQHAQTQQYVENNTPKPMYADFSNVASKTIDGVVRYATSGIQCLWFGCDNFG